MTLIMPVVMALFSSAWFFFAGFTIVNSNQEEARLNQVVKNELKLESDFHKTASLGDNDRLTWLIRFENKEKSPILVTFNKDRSKVLDSMQLSLDGADMFEARSRKQMLNMARN